MPRPWIELVTSRIEHPTRRSGAEAGLLTGASVGRSEASQPLALLNSNFFLLPAAPVQPIPGPRVPLLPKPRAVARGSLRTSLLNTPRSCIMAEDLHPAFFKFLLSSVFSVEVPANCVIQPFTFLNAEFWGIFRFIQLFLLPCDAPVLSYTAI